MIGDPQPPYGPHRREPGAPAVFASYEIALERLEPAPWNANRMSEELLAKLRNSVLDFGIVENLVVRPHPSIPGWYEVISGNQRLTLYRRLRLGSVPCHVVELDDARARLLAQTLNRTRGSDDPKAYAALLEDVLSELDLEQVLEYLPESEHSIDAVLVRYGSDERRTPESALPEPPPAAPESKLGELYELGPHRLLCGERAPKGAAEVLRGAA